MQITMMLADAVQVADGKLFILGGGWTVTGPLPTPSAIAVRVEVDAHQFGKSHHWELFLEDADGHLVQFDTPEGMTSIEVRGDFSVPEGADMLPGAPVAVPIVVNFPPLPLAPAGRYVWRFTVNGESLPGATAAFSTRPLTDEASA
jgi:hypothetical protein